MTDKQAGIGLLDRPTPRDNQLPLRIVQAVGLYRKMKIDCRLTPEDILCTLRHFRPDD